MQMTKVRFASFGTPFQSTSFVTSRPPSLRRLVTVAEATSESPPTLTTSDEKTGIHSWPGSFSLIA